MSPFHLQVLGNVFLKKALHEGTSICGEIYGEMLYIGTNDQMMKRSGGGGRGELMVKRFQRSIRVSCFLIDPDLCY